MEMIPGNLSRTAEESRTAMERTYKTRLLVPQVLPSRSLQKIQFSSRFGPTRATLQQDIAGIAATHSPVDEKRSCSLDDEKKVGAEPNVTTEHQPDSEEEEFKQNGVVRIQAISSAWSYKALIITYILFVHITAYVGNKTDARLQGYTSAPTRTPCSSR